MLACLGRLAANQSRRWKEHQITSYPPPAFFHLTSAASSVTESVCQLSPSLTRTFRDEQTFDPSTPLPGSLSNFLRISTMADKEFTYSDVSEHNTKKDLYIVVHDKVYNASSFVDEHPYVHAP